MLKKQYRIPSFKLQNPDNVARKGFSYKFSKNDLELSRFGFVVSKKLDQRAVYRNQAKRKIRSCIEEIFDNIKPGYDFIFYPRNEIMLTSQESLKKEVLESFREKKLINE